MLKIAVVANTYQDAKRFADYKFKGAIEKENRSQGIYTLKNGDEVHLCYDEGERARYQSMLFDAFLVAETYESLLDVIMHRTTRPWH